jgi:hypothetical protein
VPCCQFILKLLVLMPCFVLIFPSEPAGIAGALGETG